MALRLPAGATARVRPYKLRRYGKKEVAFTAQYKFPEVGKQRIACKVQDDMGGEGLWTGEIEVK